MRTRDIKKQAEEGRRLLKGTDYGLNHDELNQLYDICSQEGSRGGIFYAIMSAFCMGVAVGNRQAKAATKKAGV
jgi:hypothetical protein